MINIRPRDLGYITDANETILSAQIGDSMIIELVRCNTLYGNRQNEYETV